MTEKYMPNRECPNCDANIDEEAIGCEEITCSACEETFVICARCGALELKSKYHHVYDRCDKCEKDSIDKLS